MVFLSGCLMIYKVMHEYKQINFNEIDKSDNTIAYISLAEFREFHLLFDLNESVFSEFTEVRNYRSKTETEKNYIFGTLKFIEPEIENKNEAYLAFFIMKRLILLIDIHGYTSCIDNAFDKALHILDINDYSTERFFATFIDNLISNDSKTLESIEFQINLMEDKIIQKNTYKNFDEDILSYKRKLLNLRNYYEQFIDIGEEMCANSNNIFDDNNLQFFKNFIRKAERLCSDVNILRENIVQLREIYQSSLDLKLNNTMKLFTVITAIYSPLTLIAGWYGMNFRYMPELNWRYGYLFAVFLSLSALSASIIIFKKKKLL